MSVNGISNVTQAFDSKISSKVKSSEKADDTKVKDNDSDDTAVNYQKSEQPVTKNKIYQRDTATIERLKAEADKRTQSLRDLVEKMLLKQGQTFNDSTDMYALLREGKLEVDPETRAQAQKDVADDGYWGVDQTSERMFSFAKALTGGDTSKADEMIDAVKKGFEEATKTWGADLPEISKKTLDATIKKLQDWRDGKDTAANMTDTAAKDFTGQATISKITQ